MNNLEILIAGKYPNVITPTKREEDGAFDINAYFEEDYIVIPPFESKLISTGLISAFSSDYVVVFRERGSTGVKNIKINAGVIDSGFRGEWFVCLYNANEKHLLITKETNKEILNILEEDFVIYPYSKAIAQALVVNVPKTIIRKTSIEEILAIESERNTGQIGSSGK